MATQIYLGLPPPNVMKWIKDNSKPAFKLTDPLCFTAEEPNAKLTLKQGYEQHSIVTSTDNQTWAPYEVDTEIILSNIGDKVYFRAAEGVTNPTFFGGMFVINSGKIAASGNLHTLIQADGSIIDLSSTNMYFYDFFIRCTALTQSPVLPLTTIDSNCYDGMFYGCTSLKSVHFPNLDKESVASKLAIDNSFRDAASNIEAICKDGILIINPT